MCSWVNSMLTYSDELAGSTVLIGNRKLVSSGKLITAIRRVHRQRRAHGQAANSQGSGGHLLSRGEWQTTKDTRPAKHRDFELNKEGKKFFHYIWADKILPKKISVNGLTIHPLMSNYISSKWQNNISICYLILRLN